jgi:sec-independent protein translocase protein TatA
MASIGTWQLIIVLAIVLVLFGAKRLPEAARGLGKSLKIFKSETQGLLHDERPAANGQAPPAQPQQQSPRPAVEPTPPTPPQVTDPLTDENRNDTN